MPETPESLDPTIIDIERYLGGVPLPIEDATPPKFSYPPQCPHKQVKLDDQTRTVECKSCHKKLDPYWYLGLLASEWRTRRYEDERVRELAKALKQDEANAEAKGRIYDKPTEGAGIKAWEAFQDYLIKFGGTFKYMYRRRNEFYM